MKKTLPFLLLLKKLFDANLENTLSKIIEPEGDFAF